MTTETQAPQWKRRRDHSTRKLVSVCGPEMQRLRESRHMVRAHLAELAGVSPQAIEQYERRGVVPGLPAALAIIEALGGAERASSALVVGEVE